jgi:hypothetical protein
VGAADLPAGVDRDRRADAAGDRRAARGARLKLGAIFVVIGGCGGGRDAAAPAAPLETIIPWRAATAGDAVLARLAPEPDLIVELDLARLRAAERLDALEPVLGVPLDGASTVVLASYQVGTDEAATVTVVDGVVAAGPPELAAGDGVGEDRLVLRARAMPEQAEAAVVRITAALDRPAREAAVAELGVAVAPEELSVWGDVVDDLAVVAWIGAPGEIDAIVTSVRARLDALAGERAVSLLGLAPSVREVRITPAADEVRLVGLVGPRRLERAATRARSYLKIEETP